MNKRLTAISLALGLGMLAGIASAKPGDVRTLAEKSDWYADQITALDGKLYLGGSLGIREVSQNGKASKMLALPKDLDATRIVTALDGKLYTIARNTLWEVAKNGQARKVGDDWPRVSGMAGVGGKLFIVSSEELYAASTDGKFKQLGKYNWYQTRGMAELNGKLYILSREQVFEVDAETGKERALHTEMINSPVGMAATNGKLYVWHSVQTRGGKRANETALTEVDPATGALNRIPLPANWDDQASTGGPLVGMDGKLYMLMAGSQSTRKLVTIEVR